MLQLLKSIACVIIFAHARKFVFKSLEFKASDGQWVCVVGITQLKEHLHPLELKSLPVS